ncbi:hypothetical protein KC866_03295 [Patescibacteria group bacterium]|nr:hypothetical protein [Patescibacteria group bacterium]
MKNTNTWLTIVAVVVLALVGWYVIDSQQDSEKITYTEVINGEKVELDYPLIESFSNAESNTDTNNGAPQVAGVSTSVGSSVVNAVVQTITKPFIFGLYYLKNINDLGLDACTVAGGDDTNIEFPDYDEDNFQLTDVEVKNNTAYLFVDADESPKDLCAYVLPFNNMTNPLFDAIHVVVDEN